MVPSANVFRVIALRDGKPFRVIVADTAEEKSYYGKAEIGWPHNGSEETLEHLGREAAANARLISAAPDLLKACEAALYDVNKTETYLILSKAIEKAKRKAGLF